MRVIRSKNSLRILDTSLLYYLNFVTFDVAQDSILVFIGQGQVRNVGYKAIDLPMKHLLKGFGFPEPRKTAFVTVFRIRYIAQMQSPAVQNGRRHTKKMQVTCQAIKKASEHSPDATFSAFCIRDSWGVEEGKKYPIHCWQNGSKHCYIWRLKGGEIYTEGCGWFLPLFSSFSWGKRHFILWKGKIETQVSRFLVFIHSSDNTF